MSARRPIGLEPRLEDLLNDTPTRLIMARDGVDPAAVRTLMADLRRRLGPLPKPEASGCCCNA